MFLKGEKVLKAQLSSSQLFVLMGVVNALPSQWRCVIKEKGGLSRHPRSMKNLTF